jgi:hypothetical protein
MPSHETCSTKTRSSVLVLHSSGVDLMCPNLSYRTPFRANFGRWSGRVLPKMVEHFNGRSALPEFPRLHMIDFSMCAMCRREDRRPGRQYCPSDCSAHIEPHIPEKVVCIDCGKELGPGEGQTHMCPGRVAIEKEIEQIFGRYQVAYKETALPADKETESDTREKYL